jgi:hypothetical protein
MGLTMANGWPSYYSIDISTIVDLVCGLYVLRLGSVIISTDPEFLILLLSSRKSKKKSLD